MSTAPAASRRPMLTIGWVLVAVGVLLAAGSGVTLIVKIVNYVSHGLHEPIYPAPIDQPYSLRTGTYVVFERTGPSGGTTITPDQVQVTDAAGDSVATGRPSGSQTITRDGDVYSGAVSFRIRHDGEYRVRVASSAPTRFFVNRDLGSIVVSLLVWIMLVAGGVVIVIVGVVLVILDVVRKRRGPPQPPPAFAPGWYPDPAVPGRSRWWDGSAWAP